MTLPGLATVTLALSRSLAPRVLDLVLFVCRRMRFFRHGLATRGHARPESGNMCVHEHTTHRLNIFFEFVDLENFVEKVPKVLWPRIQTDHRSMM